MLSRFLLSAPRGTRSLRGCAAASPALLRASLPSLLSVTSVTTVTSLPARPFAGLPGGISPPTSSVPRAAPAPGAASGPVRPQLRTGPLLEEVSVPAAVNVDGVAQVDSLLASLSATAGDPNAASGASAAAAGTAAAGAAGAAAAAAGGGAREGAVTGAQLLSEGGGAERREHSLPSIVISGFGAGVIGINEIMYHSSVVATPAMAFAWAVERWEDVSPEALAFLHLLTPSPDYLILGTGAGLRPLPPAAHEFLQMLKIPYECMTTHRACGTFNLLCEERRRVVACVLRLSDEEHMRYTKRESVYGDGAGGTGDRDSSVGGADTGRGDVGDKRLPSALAINPLTGKRGGSGY